MTAAEHVSGQLDLDGRPIPPAQVARPNPTTITLSIEVEFDMSASECWPDGEPEQWTAEDLAREIQRDHPTLDSFISDWAALNMGGTVTVHDGHGKWGSVNLR